MTSEYPSKPNAVPPVGGVTDSDVRTPPLSTDTKPTRSTRKSQKAADAFRTIREVADALDVQQHVLRFWETKFSYVKPLKRGGGRRYYRPEDFELLKAIHCMLYTEGYTIKGVQKLLREKGKNGLIHMATHKDAPVDGAVSAAPRAQQPVLAQRPQSMAAPKSAPFSTQTAPAGHKTDLSAQQKQALRAVLQELKDIKELMKPAS